MLPVFAGYVAYSIAEKPGLVAGFVAGAIAKEGFAFGKIPYAAGGEATSTLAGVSSGFPRCPCWWIYRRCFGSCYQEIR